MIRAWKWIKNNPNRSMFLVPIILVALISISHVVTWYDMANPINWAIYLSVAIEIAAMTALVAASTKIKSGIWFMFGLVTFIQVLGNVFYCYKEIDENGELFKSWVELTSPVWELMGTTETIGLKRWLAFLEGGLLPIISLTSLHFFIRFEKPKDESQIENIVSDIEGKEYNPMTKHPQDIYYPPSKDEEIRKEYTTDVDDNEEFNEINEKINIVMSVPKGKEFNINYPLPNEIMDEDNEVKIMDIETENKEQPDLVEEENPEDEISIPKEIKKNIEKDVEINNTWKNIVKQRNNKNIRLGE